MADPAANDGVEPPSSALPRWVWIADLAALTALFVTVAVWVGGGFVAAPGGLSVSVTSPGRPLLVAALILLGRHFAVSRPSLGATGSPY